MWTLDHVGESQRGGDTKQEIGIPNNITIIQEE